MTPEHEHSSNETGRPLDVRPYQLLCLICRQGRRDPADAYHHETRLDEILAAVRAAPLAALTPRCNVSSVYRFQNPGREYDTPEGAAYNDLRDLTILQRLGMAPGGTHPAVEIFRNIPNAIPTCTGICAYPEDEAPGWPRCKFAATGNYERGLAAGLGNIVPQRDANEQAATKKRTAAACLSAQRLRIRPHHLLCMTCFHAGRADADVTPVPAENLAECIAAMRANPDIPVELIEGPCMVCPPCDLYHPANNLCIGSRGMGLRDEKKDLDTLRKTGLRYGDVLPARKLMRRVFAAIHATTAVCGFGDGIERGREWRVCGGPTGKEAFVRARKCTLGMEL